MMELLASYESVIWNLVDSGETYFQIKKPSSRNDWIIRQNYTPIL